MSYCCSHLLFAVKLTHNILGDGKTSVTFCSSQVFFLCPLSTISSRGGNAYYHCRLGYVLLKWPAFCGQLLVVQDEEKECLSDSQKALLHIELHNHLTV